MNSSKSDLIHITHYINPHMFWFKYESSLLCNKVLLQLENEMQIYFGSNQKNLKGDYQPKIGEIVALLNLNLNKWIRVQVDAILENQFDCKEKQLVLWAIDHGIPLLSKSKWTTKLPKHFAVVETNSVIFGGMTQIVPAEKKYNLELNLPQLEVCENWSESSIKLVENFINDAATILFTPDFDTLKYSQNHVFGTIEIRHDSSKILLPTTILCNLDQAKISNNFLFELKLLKTLTIPRWHNNAITNKLNGRISNNSSVPKILDNKLNTQHNLIIQKVIDWEIKNDEYLSKVDKPLNDECLSICTEGTLSMDKSSTYVGLLKHKKTTIMLNDNFSSVSQKEAPNSYKKDISTRQSIKDITKSLSVSHLDSASKDCSLFKEKNTNEQPIIIPAGANINNCIKKSLHEFKYFDKSDSPCFMKFLIFHRVFIHGNMVPKPIDKIENAFFAETVHNGLNKRGINQVFRIQGYSWPHILSENSFFVINNSKTGKTMSYLPAICTLIHLNCYNVTNHCGPICLIICPNGVKGSIISKLCNDFLLESTQRVKIVEVFNLRKISSIQTHLLNGCDILITNTLCLETLLKSSIKTINLERLKYFIIDELDVIMSKTIKPLQYIISYCCGDLSSKSIENGINKKLQIIITSHVWHNCIRNFMNAYNNFLLCIGSYIEAAVYAGTEFSLNMINKNDKSKFLLNLLKTIQYVTCRTMIICANNKDLNTVCDTLRAASILFIKCLDSSLSEEIDLASNWNNVEENQLPILVATDNILHEINVNKIQNMIHYSLPEKWSRFCFRFSLFFQFFFKQFHSNINKNVFITKSIIILDEDSNEYIPKLIDFMRNRLKSDIPTALLDLSKKIRLDQEEKKLCNSKNDKIISLCENLLTFGNCYITNCPFRHILTKFDHASDNLPKSGYIKIEIMNIYNPIKYSVRLLQHKEFYNSKWRVVNKSNEYTVFLLNMNNYLSKEINHKSHFPIKLNDLCCICNNNVYYRCKIIGIKERKSALLKNKYNIKLIDTNKYIICLSNDLLHLPEEFIQFPAQGVDLRIAGLININLELEWDVVSIINAKHWLKINNTNTFIEGEIKLVISDLIFVDNLKLIENLQTISTHVNAMSLKDNLINKNWGISNNIQIINLSLMAKNCGLIDNHVNDCNYNVNKDMNSLSGAISKVHQNSSKNICTESKELFSKHLKKENGFVKDVNEKLDDFNHYDIPYINKSDSINIIVEKLFKSIKIDNDKVLSPVEEENVSLQSLKPYDTILDNKTFKTMYTNNNKNNENLILFDDVKPEGNINDSVKPQASDIFLNYQDKCLNNSNMPLIEIESFENDKTENNLCITNYTSLQNAKILSPIREKKCCLNNLQDVSNKTFSNNNLVKESEKFTIPKVATINKDKTKIYNEKWENLNDNVFEPCVMLTFYNPDYFYIQRCTTDDINKLNLLYEKIAVYINSLNLQSNNNKTENLPNLKNDKYCLVNFENIYNRGKILDVLNENELKIFFCDYGECKVVDIKDILPITDDILSIVPFMSIKCKLIGIKSNNDTWNNNVCDLIYDNIIKNCFNMYVRYFKRHYINEENSYYYEVMLLNRNTNEDINIAKAIVEKEYGEYENETKHFLNIVYTIEEDPNANNISNDSNKFDIDIDFSINDVAELMGFSLPINSTVDTKDNFLASDNKNTNNLIELHNDEQDDEEKIPNLKRIYKFSEVKWQQDNNEVNLKIKIDDNVNYIITAKTRFIKVFIKNINNNDDNILILLHLFGCIEPKYTVHRTYGIYLKICLEKSVKNYEWPRLLLHNDRNNFIKYDFDFIKYDDDDEDADKVKLELVGIDNNNSDTENDDSDVIDDYDPFDYIF